MVIKEFKILMLKSPLNQERYKILLMIYFLIYRNLLEFITFVQSITSDYMSRWVVMKMIVGAVTSQRVLKVLFYVDILQCFFVVETFTVSAVSVAS
jgi:hypothetical protein